MKLATAVVALAIASLAAGPPSARSEDLISGIGLTHLTVYDQRPAPDGLMSGTPHVHAVTDEGYYVISGRGKVELHDLESGFRTVDLEPGRYLQFPPGTLHRLVNTDHLVLLVVMGYAGLAERGDARIYFGKAVDKDPDEFARLVGLAKAKGLEGALDRRDAAIRGYMSLVELWTKDQPAYYMELARFIRVHMKAEDRDRGERGPDDREHDAPPDAQLARPVDPPSVEKIIPKKSVITKPTATPTPGPLSRSIRSRNSGGTSGTSPKSRSSRASRSGCRIGTSTAAATA